MVQVIHTLLSRSLIRQEDSIGVVSARDILYLYSMVERITIHLGYEIVNFIKHHAHNLKVSVIFVGPYIMRLLRGLRVLAGTKDMQRVSATVPLSMETL